MTVRRKFNALPIKNQESLLSYRPDIDGLRAVAVLLVVFFHLGFTSLTGGYVGVDIFFVISGFLITGIIRNEYERTGDFDFSRFYTKRAKRLLPALFSMLLVSTIIAFSLFTPTFLMQYLESLIYAALSLSNFFFWSESGYFDIDSSFKPLLHTWSLGVEEQFYFIWPLVLFFLFKVGSRAVVPLAILGVSIISLGLNLVFQNGAPIVINELSVRIASALSDGGAAIYLLTPFRVFEFGIGALLCWLPKPGRVYFLEAAVALGLSLIVYAVFVFDEKTIFPSYNALIPCFGAALVIYGGGGSFLGRVVGNPVSVKIGVISYSLYLVHWPVIVFYKYSVGGDVLLEAQVFLLCLCLFLALLMNKYIEAPFRYGFYFSSLSGKGSVAIFAVPLMIFSCVGFYGVLGKEADSNVEGRGSYLSSEKGCYILGGKNCKSNAELQVLTFGNSHELDAYNAMTHVFGDREDINFMSFGTSHGCTFRMIGGKVGAELNSPDLYCNERAERLNDKFFINNLDVVVFSAHKPISWAYYQLEILSHMRRVNPDLKVIFFSGYIGIRPNRCDDLVARFGTADACKRQEFVDYFAADEKDKILNLPVAQNNFLYVDKVELFCNERKLENCLMQAGGQPAFLDGDHLTVAFAKLLGEKISIVYRKQLTDFGF